MEAAVDIENPNNADLMIAAMERFLERNVVNGVFVGSPDSPDFNNLPVPCRPEDQEQDLIVRFPNAERFEYVHRTASLFEENVECHEVEAVNELNSPFRAWPIVALPSGNEEENWLILVEPQQHIITLLPSVGEFCQLRIIDPTTKKDISAWWTAQRVNCHFPALDNGQKKDWADLVAFNITLTTTQDDSVSVIHALVPNDDQHEQNLANLVLDDGNALHAGLFFTRSDATFSAEMAALGKLARASGSTLAAGYNAASATQKKTGEHKPKRTGLDKRQDINLNPNAIQDMQLAAFRYILDFQNPAFSINVFNLYPHMKDPESERGIPKFILSKYRRLNEHQRDAYHGLLSDMPCGLGILPGCPGGGKTDWAMTVIGLMQSKSSAKVLYLLDINEPLDDATAKYVKMIKAAGLAKYAIRMRNFGTELKRSVRVGSVQNRARGNGGNEKQGAIHTDKHPDEPEVDFSKNFLKMYSLQVSGSGKNHTTRHQGYIPTLDEAAWDYYEASKDDFSRLTELLETCNDSAVETRSLRRQIYVLYETVLQRADFIATTPCAAATFFRRMFEPDLVVFDEAAHARELSTLIAIANFRPAAGWILIGDHRQTQPMVRSHDTNPFGRQLATSVMERAHMAGALKHELLINHRAFGRLERLPSKMVYEGKMISGIPFKDRFPPCSKAVRAFFENLAGQRCSVPRLIVHLLQIGWPSQVGTSWHHPHHLEWTMKRVLELVQNPAFRNAENTANPGTILLLAPYRAAVTKYQEAIADMDEAYPAYKIRERVEARTWDSAQGHEADIIGIDYVRDHPTGFMDGMYRFNVGLTRARQGEWHLVHPSMPTRTSFQQTKYLRKLYRACREGLDGLGEGRVVSIRFSDGQIARVPPGPLPPPARPAADVATEDDARETAAMSVVPNMVTAHSPNTSTISSSSVEVELEAGQISLATTGTLSEEDQW